VIIMPLPQPGGDETAGEFMERCMSDPKMVDEYDEDQRAAICHSQLEKAHPVTGTKHEQLLSAIKARRARGQRERFGYGIGTADSLVAKALEGIGDDKTFFMGGGPVDREAAVKEAASRLVSCQPEARIEQTATVANFKSLLPEGIQAPPHTLMILRYTLTTPRKDHDGDILHPEGADVDASGPMLWQHLFMQPIGKLLSVVEKSPRALRETSCLLDLNDFTEDIAKMFEAGVLRFSHGFQAIDWRELKADPTGYPKAHSSGKIGFEVLKYEVLERSAVSIPSNADAILELHGRGKLASGYFKKQAQTLLERRAAMARGVTLKAGEADEPDKYGSLAECVAAKVEEGMSEDEATTACQGLVAAVEEQAAESKAAKPTDAAGEQLEGKDSGEEAKKPDDEGEEPKVCPECGEKLDAEGKCPKCDKESPAKAEGDEDGDEQMPGKGLWLTIDEMRAICPTCAGRMEKANLSRVNLEKLDAHTLAHVASTMQAKLRRVNGEKAGRVLSGVNLASLGECLADLQELATMDMPRPAKAMLERTVARLEALISAATPATTGPSQGEPQTERRGVFDFLAKADPEDLRRVSRIVGTMLKVEEGYAAGDQYRDLVRK
jgi:hypothetical protein